MSFIQKRLVAAGHLEPFKAVKLFSLNQGNASKSSRLD
jgi:hypothetical protein